MTGYPNEDEGPDEVIWEETNMPEVKAEHTPLPWVGFFDAGKLVAIMPAGRPGDICTFAQSPSGADGDLLLRSVSAVPTLVRALEEARANLLALKPRSDTGSIRSERIDVYVSRINAALAKVKP